ncbi:MAG: Signal transduction histidine kinase CheA, partial [Myxococcaceae bacterium]|nr:Signal transduction histidine kinase CheA [Myxococcaceae bacterium]
ALMTGLSHELEDVLDDLRLGRLELTPAVLDLLFRAVELYGRILGAERGDSLEPAGDVKALLLALGQLAHPRPGGGASPVAQYELDPGLLGVLTEYEEHRLRTNIQAGVSLFRLRVQFALATIDTALDELKAKARPHGEIITYLPTGGAGDSDSIELEILMASHTSVDTLVAAMGGPHIAVEEVRRRGMKTIAPSLARESVIPGAPGVAKEFQVPGVWPDESRTHAQPAGAIVGIPRAPQQTAPLDQVPRSEGPRPPRDVTIANEPSTGGGREMSLRSVSQTVRVDIRKLDHLMNIVGELAIVRTAISKLAERVKRFESRELASELHRLNRAFERNLAQMQNGILEVRMVPLGQAFDKLARIVRQISREHDKQVHLVVTGAETEIDKLIVEELSDPLMHMIRNAIDHGIESRDDRIKVGKPPVGTIALNAFQKGNHVVLEVEDDGTGMEPAFLLASAVRKGLVTEEQAKELSSREILALVFLPGFTTKLEATDISGRGVGMDIVKTNINKLGGVIDISSEIGIGTKMTITLPITLAIISVLMVEIAGRVYAMPLASVEEAITFDEKDVRTVEGREVMNQRGRTLPICRLARLFGFENGTSPASKSFVVVGAVANRKLGFVVDKLIGQQDIVIKALGKSLSATRGFAGATELGDQRVALVLDAAALIEEVLAGDKDRYLAEGRA